MDKVTKFLEKLSFDELSSMRKKVCAMSASDDKNWNNLLDCIEMEIIELVLTQKGRLEANDIYHAVSALSNISR